jgi:hypothetical protein
MQSVDLDDQQHTTHDSWGNVPVIKASLSLSIFDLSIDSTPYW